MQPTIAPPAPDPSNPEALNIQFERRIAEGGMAEIWQAIVTDPSGRAPRFARVVKVLKLGELAGRGLPAAILENVVERFRDEVRVYRDAGPHPGLMAHFSGGRLSNAYAAAPERGQPHSYYNVLDFVSGDSLEDYALERRWPGAPPPGTPLRDDSLRRIVRLLAFIGRQIAEALEAMHDASMRHRDISPDNILVLSDPSPLKLPRAFLIDFGIAKLPGGAEKRSQFRAGKEEFTPREVKSLEDARSPEVDLYALARSLRKALALAICGHMAVSDRSLTDQWPSTATMPSSAKLEEFEAAVGPVVDAPQPSDRGTIAGLRAKLKKIHEELGLVHSTPADESGKLMAAAFARWESAGTIDASLDVDKLVAWARSWPLTEGELSFVAGVMERLAHQTRDLAERDRTHQLQRRRYKGAVTVGGTIIMGLASTVAVVAHLLDRAKTAQAVADKTSAELRATTGELQASRDALEQEKGGLEREREDRRKSEQEASAQIGGLKDDVASKKRTCDEALGAAQTAYSGLVQSYWRSESDANNCVREACTTQTACNASKRLCDAEQCMTRVSCDLEKRHCDATGCMTTAACDNAKQLCDAAQCMTKTSCDSQTRRCDATGCMTTAACDNANQLCDAEACMTKTACANCGGANCMTTAACDTREALCAAPPCMTKDACDHAKAECTAPGCMKADACTATPVH
ncbi:MAG: hypothetical protein ABIO72_02565 [Patescibacteria group bacterium]